MGWKDERKTSVGAAWGHAPSLVEGVPARTEEYQPEAEMTPGHRRQMDIAQRRFGGFTSRLVARFVGPNVHTGT